MREAEELGGVPRSDRYSSSDWLHNTLSLPSSAILRSIRGPVFFMTAWAGLLSFAHRRFLITSPAIADYMCIPLAPHSLMVSALSLLLVFKTNSAYQRFAEGRKIWENIINNARDLYRMMNLYENEMGRSKRRRLQRLLAAFPYLLRHRIRPNLVMYRLDDVENVRDPEHSIVLYQDKAANDLDPEAAKVATQEENEGMSRRKPRPLYWVDKRTLPWRLLPPDALEPCARAQNRPLWVCDRMALELKNIPDGPHFSARERLALITKVERLSQCIGACERIHQTVVPLNYARHSLRALTLFLFTLPFCLVEPLKLLTAPALFLISWLMFGIYEIGYSIEDPFQGTLRLSVLCDAIRRDVLADEVIRSTAFVSTNVEEMKSEATISIIDAENIQDDDGDYEDYENSSIVKEKKRTKTDTKIQFEGFSETPVVSEDYLRKKP
jgi:predicted membrane chloride channel (bestrophin family)